MFPDSTGRYPKGAASVLIPHLLQPHCVPFPGPQTFSVGLGFENVMEETTKFCHARKWWTREMRISRRTWTKVEEHVSYIQVTAINKFNEINSWEFKRLIRSQRLQDPRPCEHRFKLKGLAKGFRVKGFSCPEPETFSWTESYSLQLLEADRIKRDRQRPMVLEKWNLPWNISANESFNTQWWRTNFSRRGGRRKIKIFERSEVKKKCLREDG